MPEIAGIGRQRAKGHCIPPHKGHCSRSQKLLSLYIENLREEDNLSIKDKTAEFILSPKCPLFGGSTIALVGVQLGSKYISTLDIYILPIIYSLLNFLHTHHELDGSFNDLNLQF